MRVWNPILVQLSQGQGGGTVLSPFIPSLLSRSSTAPTLGDIALSRPWTHGYLAGAKKHPKQLPEQLALDGPVDVGEPEVAAAPPVGQALVVDA